MKEYILEACVDSVESAMAAVEGGADRLELCGNLIIGGTTPGPWLFDEIRKRSDIRIHALIRPRFGDFCYTDAEFSMIKHAVEDFRKMGAEGVVFGVLKPDGTLNMEQMKELMEAAGDMSVTLHRAFDVCVDPIETMEQAISLGINTILTSGQRNVCLQGADLLKELVEKSLGRITIQAGSGVGAEVIRQLYPLTGVRAYHMTGKRVIDSEIGTVTADTSALESALETASDELAELQSDLASEKAIAEADSTSLTKEEKEKLKVTDNLSELDAKSAEELVKEGKKGITAEFNGIISKADIKQGAAVTQGMELFTIENTDKASVDVTLSKYDYNTVKEGQSVEITLGDNTYQGTVTKMSHIAVQNEKGTPVISATVSIDNPDEDIFLGVDAKVKIYAASAKNVVTLPVEVVNIGKEGSFCYVIEDGLVTKRNITTGISSEDYVEITDGIKEGEEVIADLGDYTEGMEVQAVPEQTGEDADE